LGTIFDAGWGTPAEVALYGNSLLWVKPYRPERTYLDAGATTRAFFLDYNYGPRFLVSYYRTLWTSGCTGGVRTLNAKNGAADCEFLPNHLDARLLGIEHFLVEKGARKFACSAAHASLKGGILNQYDPFCHVTLRP
jgi:hypothetical protein